MVAGAIGQFMETVQTCARMGSTKAARLGGTGAVWPGRAVSSRLHSPAQAPARDLRRCPFHADFSSAPKGTQMLEFQE